MNESIKKWTAENEPIGKKFGYPSCCIKAFCKMPPEALKDRHVTRNDKRRLKAAYIGEYYTGFIPCAAHAKEIINGKTTLSDLIENRDPSLAPFPYETQQNV